MKPPCRPVALPDTGRVENPATLPRIEFVIQMGAAGLEPATSWL